MKRKKFMIVDGSSLVHRAFYALPLLTNREGVFTNAAYGFTNMFLKILENEKPSFVVVCFDKKRETFRNRQYEQYKIHRKKTPVELKLQFELVKKIISALGIKHCELDDYEADDLIGTLVRRAEEEGVKNIIVTGDKDVLQLVSPSTEVLLTKKGISELERYGVEDVKKRYGLTPKQLIDLKGLMGDPSDNIPGVHGIGEKTAIKLLREFTSVEGVFDNLEVVSGKLRNKLAENKENALMSKKLATIDINAPLELELQECVWQGPNYHQLLEVFKELEFTSLIKKILREMEEEDTDGENRHDALNNKVKFIKSNSELEKALKEIGEKDVLSVYVALDGENYHKAKIKGVGLAWNEDALAIEGALIEAVKPALQELLSGFSRVIFHDAKKIYVAFKKVGISVPKISGDALIAAYLLNPTASSYLLPELALEYLDLKLTEKDDPVINAAILARTNLKLIEVLENQLDALDMSALYHQVEIPLIRILAEMELTGIKVDRKILSEMEKEFKKGIEKLEKEIYEMADEEFNINSPKQLGKILFEKMDLPVIKRTKTGYSTSAEVLEELAEKHPIAEKLLSYRQLTKLQSTYVEGLKKLLTKDDKIHTTFNQTITATGRLSSTEPNLQNIPIRLELGRRLRRVFIPSQKDYCILSADYSQIELRVLAHISQDENLMDAFIKGQDIHTRTASEVFHVSMDKVTREMRNKAKAVNFGIVYGISDYGLSRDLGIPRSEAKEYIEKYFERYPGVAEYMKNIVMEAREKGYVTTLLYRKRSLPDIFSPNRNIRNFGERTAMNTPIQGSAADIIKLAMVEVNERITAKELPAVMLLQLHDELIFEVKEEALKEIASEIVDAMENAYHLRVPLKVDVKYGKNWYDLKALK